MATPPLSGVLSEVIPPVEADTLRDVHFTVNGRRLLGRLVNLLRLQPSSVVLDVGCGTGRLALQLTDVLNQSGSYLGIDVFRPSLQWCTDMIVPRFPNFSFYHVDVFNRIYNPHGRYYSHDVLFPCADATVDIVVLNSLFTHMLPADLWHYFVEIKRVLRRGGRVYATFFVINADSEVKISLGRSSQRLVVCVGRCRTLRDEQPEAAIGYSETLIRDLFRAVGLRIVDPIYYGSWCGRARFVEYQDIVIGLGESQRQCASDRLIFDELLETQKRLNLLSARALFRIGCPASAPFRQREGAR